MFKSTSHHKQRLLKVGAVAVVGLIGSIALFSNLNKSSQPTLTSLAQTTQCQGIDPIQWQYMISYLDTQDTNRDGRYSFPELRQMFGNPDDMTYTYVQQLLDTNGNGYLDLDEFCTMMQQNGQMSFVSMLSSTYRNYCPYNPNGWAQQVQAFDTIDANGNGKITKKELDNLFIKAGSPLTPQTLDLYMSLFDVNGDGFITIDEWCIIQQYSSSSSLFSILQTAQTQASCPYMSPNDWQFAQQSFPLIDTNGNGEIDAYELKTFYAVNQVPITDDEFNQVWEFIDQADNGFITLADICDIYNPQRYSPQQSLFLSVFGQQ